MSYYSDDDIAVYSAVSCSCNDDEGCDECCYSSQDSNGDESDYASGDDYLPSSVVVVDDSGYCSACSDSDSGE